jgi:NlpC/P60 family
MNFVARKVGGWLSRYLSKENKRDAIGIPTDIVAMQSCLQRGDVVLVEGNTKFSTAIKYLSQSTWSHAMLYIGNGEFIEADVSKGIIRSNMSELEGYHTRICRPIGLTQNDIDAVCYHAVSKLGGTYDLRNVFDLIRYLVPVLPFPARHRRKLLAFGSGDPTKAVCSTLVAEAFESVRYPILPKVGRASKLQKRHHTLITPRDFDVSPYFKVVKPTVELGFDFRAFEWNK